METMFEGDDIETAWRVEDDEEEEKEEEEYRIEGVWETVE